MCWPEFHDSKLTAIHSGSVAQADSRVPVDLAGLGTAVWHQDAESWIVRVQHGQQSIAIELAGDAAPYEELVHSARAIVRSLEPFLARAAAARARAVARIPADSSEILGLTVESISLPWRARPNDGMIYFDGPETEERLWRCDFVDGVPQELDFDD